MKIGIDLFCKKVYFCSLMAGHSKWANIKRRKERQDSKKSKVYTKLLKEISVAAGLGKDNPKLKIAIENAKAQSVPKENIERIINKSILDKDNPYQEEQYEGYGAGGVAILILTLSHNQNCTRESIRTLFHKNGASLGKQGKVRHLFDHLAYFLIALKEDSPENIEEYTLEWIESGAERIINKKESIEIFAPLKYFNEIQKKIEEQGFELKIAKLDYIPSVWSNPTEEEKKMNQNLINLLKDDIDVQEVYHNML